MMRATRLAFHAAPVAGAVALTGGWSTAVPATSGGQSVWAVASTHGAYHASRLSRPPRVIPELAHRAHL